MREIVSPLDGIRSPLGSVSPLAIYAVLGIRPELVLDFDDEKYFANSTSTTFSDAITHSASSNATMVDSDGLLKWRPHNLLTYSEQFDNAAWTKTGVSVSSVDGVYEIETTATNAYIESSQSGIHQHSGAFEIKAGTAEWVFIALIGYNQALAYFNVGSGVVGTVNSAATASITALEDNWYRCNFTFYDDGTSAVAFRLEIVDADATSSVSIGKSLFARKAHLYRSDLGGMVNNPDRGDSYVPTTSSAVYLPRRGHHVYNGTSWVNEGLLHESEQRVNLESQSNGLTSWGVDVGSSISASTVEGQDGSFLTELNEGTSTGAHRANRSISSIADTEYTYSAEIAPGTSRYVIFGNNYGGICIDTTDGSITQTLAAASTTTTNGNVEDIGNGHFRASVTVKHATVTTLFTVFSTSDTATPGTTTLGFTGTSRTGYFGLVQVEQASTPSSYIPTSGATVTRAAETLTIPSAALPWPTPNVIGPELVTNGTFDTDTSGWTAAGGATLTQVDGKMRVTNDADGFSYGWRAISCEVGKVYQLSVDISFSGSPQATRVMVDTASNFPAPLTAFTTIDALPGTKTVFFVADAATLYVGAQLFTSNSGVTADFDNISVREIDPLAVSIQMQGRMTYADEDSFSTIFHVRWYKDSNNYIYSTVDTAGAFIGRPKIHQAALGVVDSVAGSAVAYSPGINVPFNIASRHGSTFINGAVDGTALTADLTPTALPDLSATDLSLGFDYMGTIKLFRIWADDLGDTGIAEASS